MEGLQKDFKVVGSSRVHAWYAWAIVGIVFGMALGIVYVANRSTQFVSTQAAVAAKSTSLNFNFAVNGELDAYVPVWMNLKNNTVWFGGRPVPYVKSEPLNVARPTRTPPGDPIGPYGMQNAPLPYEANDGVVKSPNYVPSIVGVKGTAIYLPTISQAGRTLVSTIDTTRQSPFAMFDKTVSIKLKGIYVQEDATGQTKNNRIEVPITAAVLCVANLTENSTCSDSSRKYEADTSGTIKVPAGVPVYLKYFSFMTPGKNSVKKNMLKTIVFSAAAVDSSYKIIIKKSSDNSYSSARNKYYVDHVIRGVGTDETGVILDSIVNETDGEQ